MFMRRWVATHTPMGGEGGEGRHVKDVVFAHIYSRAIPATYPVRRLELCTRAWRGGSICPPPCVSSRWPLTGVRCRCLLLLAAATAAAASRCRCCCPLLLPGGQCALDAAAGCCRPALQICQVGGGVKRGKVVLVCVSARSKVVVMPEDSMPKRALQSTAHERCKGRVQQGMQVGTLKAKHTQSQAVGRQYNKMSVACCKPGQMRNALALLVVAALYRVRPIAFVTQRLGRRALVRGVKLCCYVHTLPPARDR